MEFKFKAIGVIHSCFTTKEEAPIQGSFHPDANGKVEVFAEFSEGLQDIEVSKIMLSDEWPYLTGTVQEERKEF